MVSQGKLSGLIFPSISIRTSNSFWVSRKCKRQRIGSGYSLVELLVVLAIVGILALVGVLTIGDRKGNSVRAVMDQVEGTILLAQKNAMATGQDIYLASNGTWTATGASSLTGSSARLTVDPRAFDPADTTTPIDAYQHARRGALAEVFISQYQTSRDHMHAGVATDATILGWATGLKGYPPFTAGSGGDAVLAQNFKDSFDNQLCQVNKNYVIVNGMNGRFQTGFSVVIVSLTSSGIPDPNGPMGVLVVPQNAANVYRFYKPANDNWRRL